MVLRKRRRLHRKGAVAVLTAVLAVPLLGMVAFAVDLAWVASTKARLQTAADAAALAGARQLINNYVTFNAPLASGQATLLANAQASAKTWAKKFATYNSAGSVASLTLADADIEFGYTSAAGNYTKLTGTTTYPNTVKVTLRLDGSTNAGLNLFFAPLLGVSSTTVTATASAVIYTASSVSSFNSSAGINGLLLPVAMDVNAWTTFYATGKSPDGFVHLGANGQPQLQIYPSPGNAPGNFGLMSVGPPATSTPPYANWIDNGASPSDLQYLNDNNLAAATHASPKSWAGGPGLSSALKSDFASVAGQARLIPIFQPVSTSPYQAAGGNGSHTTYAVVGYVGVTISDASGSGNNMNIAIQPAATLDPTLVYDPSTIVPAGEGAASTTTMVLPKLTQ